MFFRHAKSQSQPDAPMPPAPKPVFDRRKLRAMPPPESERGLLTGMRIRKKLIVLHTIFSLALAAVLVLAIRPAVQEVVERAELDESMLLLETLAPSLQETGGAESLGPLKAREAELAFGTAAELGIPDATVVVLLASPGRAVAIESPSKGRLAAMYVPSAGDQRFVGLRVEIAEARQAVGRVYILMSIALLSVYALVAIALETLVLPQNVYRPIRRLLAADSAVVDGRSDEELVPESAIPADELGEIMRSRNQTISRLRQQEAELADALIRLEAIANDLKRKNHLLETARRNLADADRLASLGMMSAGIAHELNTPLAVIKGLAEQLDANPSAGLPEAQSALMLRVVRRLEKLGDSLLDFARVRPPETRSARVGDLIAEAVTLVKLDREAAGVEFESKVPEGIEAVCDSDRITQVLVNIIRNAVDAVRSGPTGRGTVAIHAAENERDGRMWLSITITDDGPGIDPVVMTHLFEPFVSTRLDSRGTGLGLAVAEGIVREHGGVLLARNRSDRTGASFEVILPRDPSEVPQGRSSVESST